MSDIFTSSQTIESGRFEELSSDSKAYDLMIRGKNLNSATSFSQEAFDLLTKAIKLNPYLIEAWIELTTCYQNRLDFDGATACLENALKYCNSKEPNKIVLRKLSTCIRQKTCDSQETKITTLLRSLDLSKQALKCDMFDEENYYNLAKAYLCLFFATECVDQQLINLSKAAYLKALSLSNESYSKVKNKSDQQPLENDKDIVNKLMDNNLIEKPRKPFIKQSDFLFNFSTVLVYLQEFQKAIEYLREAIILDRDWDEPKNFEESLVNYLKQVYLMMNDVSKNSKKVVKRYSKIIVALNNVSKIENIILLDQVRLTNSTNIKVKSIDLIQIQKEYMNLKNSSNPTLDNKNHIERSKISIEDNYVFNLLHLKLIGTINYNQAMYLTFIAIDHNYSTIVLTIYNLAASKCPTPRDVVTIINPKIEEIKVEGLIDIGDQRPTISFKRIDVREFKSLYVNGYRITRDQVSNPQFKVSVLP